VATDAAEGLYRLVDAAYEKRSVAISSNLHPSGFDELMPKTLATATVDRLLHHAHVCQTSGDSVRLPSPGRRRGEAAAIAPTVMAPDVQNPWPSPGKTRDRHRAAFLSATGQNSMSLDITRASASPVTVGSIGGVARFLRVIRSSTRRHGW